MLKYFHCESCLQIFFLVLRGESGGFMAYIQRLHSYMIMFPLIIMQSQIYLKQYNLSAFLQSGATIKISSLHTIVFYSVAPNQEKYISRNWILKIAQKLLTLCTARGWPNSRPPCRRNPQGILSWGRWSQIISIVNPTPACRAVFDCKWAADPRKKFISERTLKDVSTYGKNR